MMTAMARREGKGEVIKHQSDRMAYLKKATASLEIESKSQFPMPDGGSRATEYPS